MSLCSRWAAIRSTRPRPLMICMRRKCQRRAAAMRKRTQIPLPPAEELPGIHPYRQWVKEGLQPQITEVHAHGVPHIIKTGTMTGKLDNNGRFLATRD